jgi:ABC-type transporter Mla maintaining outer membrane lipid asymmetry ATPase subunit MlaF
MQRQLGMRMRPSACVRVQPRQPNHLGTLPHHGQLASVKHAAQAQALLAAPKQQPWLTRCCMAAASTNHAVAASPHLEASDQSTAALQQAVADSGDVLIEFRDVHKSFGDKPILRGASFQIRRGEAVGIIGASGTGKSTTLRIAAGLLAPDSGEVLIKGRQRTGLLSDQTSQNEEQLSIGMVFQNAALFDSLTVGENVGFLLYEHSNLPEPRIKELVAESLARVGLPGVEGLYPAELSGGMKKRVALARAVVRDVRAATEQVIMYDEPTAGLDPVASTVVEDLMRNLHNNSGNGGGGSNGGRPLSGISSYIVVTHQHSTIRRAVDRIIFLHKGKVAWEGSVAEFDTTQEPIVRQFAEGSLDGPIQYL